MSPPRHRRATPGWWEVTLACGLLSTRCMRVWLACAVAGLAGAGVQVASATCNIIPSPDRSFGSTLGTVSAPYARPGDRVILRRDEPVFSSTPAGNRVTLHFQPPGGAGTTIETVSLPPDPLELDVDSAEQCRCAAPTCPCLWFDFPLTGGTAEGLPAGHPLTGPVSITVETGGDLTAMIGPLREPDSELPQRTFPRFVGLPPPNRFADLLAASHRELLAAVDGAGNLFVPVNFAGVRAEGLEPKRIVSQAPLVEVASPLLGLEPDLVIESFDPRGRRLAAIIRRVGTEDVLATADGPDAVLRVAGSGHASGLVQEAGKGPVIVPQVVGRADPRKRAEWTTLTVGDHFAVYENQECSPTVEESYCRDLNGDGDMTDRFLRALDLRVPGSAPIVVHEVDERFFAVGFLGCPYASPVGNGRRRDIPPFGLYQFVATDELVAFSVPETECFDFDGSGFPSGVLDSGAFDLERGSAVESARGSPRLEVSGHLLAFSERRPSGDDALLVYDSSERLPRPRDVPQATGITDSSFGTLRFWGYEPFTRDLAVPGDFAVRAAPGGGHVAFVVRENARGEDLTGDGSTAQLALLVLDTAAGVVTNLHQPVSQSARLRLTDRWLVAEVPLGERSAVAVYDLARLDAPPRLICSDPSRSGLLTASLSDTVVPCAATSSLFADPYRRSADATYDVHVFLPDAPEGAVEVALGLRVFSPYDVLVERNAVAIGVEEAAQGEDLDGDGILTSPLIAGIGPEVVHLFDPASRAFRNLGTSVAVARHPLLQFVTGADGAPALVVIEERLLGSGGPRLGRTYHLAQEPAGPPNDACEAATEVTAIPFADTRGTQAASTALADPVLSCAPAACYGGKGSGSVWYRFIAPADGSLTVDMRGTGHRTVVALHSGPCAALHEAACRAVPLDGTGASEAFAVAAGEPYLVEVVGGGCRDVGTRVVEIDFRAICEQAADCAASVACTVADCVDHRCILTRAVGFEGALCELDHTVFPAACRTSPRFERAVEHRLRAARRLLARAARARRPQRRDQLLARADHRLAAISGLAKRMLGRHRIVAACVGATDEVVEPLRSTVSGLRS